MENIGKHIGTLLILIVFLTMPVLAQVSKNPDNWSDSRLAVYQTEANLVKLHNQQIQLENEIINTTIGWWFPSNNRKISEFDRHYRSQLTKINCYRTARASINPPCLYENLNKNLDVEQSSQVGLSVNNHLKSSETLDIAISNSKRIRERIRTLRQNNLSRTAILISTFAILITLIVEFPKLKKYYGYVKKWVSISRKPRNNNR